MNSKADSDCNVLLLSKRAMSELEKEHKFFRKWVGQPMTVSEFVEYLLYQFKRNRTTKRVYWQFYSITPRAVKMFDRKEREKITIKRAGRKLYCLSCRNEKCGHCIFALNDRDVKKSLDIEYIHKITRVFGSNFPRGDFEAETW